MGGGLYLVEGGTRPDHHRAAIGRTEGVTHGGVSATRASRYSQELRDSVSAIDLPVAGA